MNEKFFTFNEYIKKDTTHLTPSMEDYVEMIYRLSLYNGFTRVQDLSNYLNVQPPSVTKMMQKLAKLKLIKYEKYGLIILTESGKIRGEFFLLRHNIIEKFLKIIGVKNSLFEETERIEHTINDETLKCINEYLNFLNSNPQIIKEFNLYKKSFKNSSDELYK